jgi:signal transduction histidine kinase
MITCLDSTANLWGMFDTTLAPTLLYYSYVPVIIAILSLATFVLLKLKRNGNRDSSILIVLISITYSFYLFNEIMQWISVSAGVVNFSWQLIILLRILLALLVLYFVISLSTTSSLHKSWYLLGLILLTPVLLFLPTSLNTTTFDIALCEPGIGILHVYLYATEILIMGIITYVVFKVIRRTENQNRRIQMFLLLAGSLSFIAFISLIDLFAEAMGMSYEINLVSPIGALIFVGTMTYMIIQYNTFNLKIFGSQALVVTLWFLIGSLLFVVVSPQAFVIVIITFVLSVIFGLSLIRSVKYEVEARKLLMEANAGQERFIHFLGHEIKGFFTVARSGYASITEGDFGPVPEPLARMAKNALSSMNVGVTTVDGILKSANLKSGNVNLTYTQFDLCEAIRKRVEMASLLFEEHGLSVTVHVPETSCMIEADEEHITNHVLRNIIENAIYYTPSGSINISLSRGVDTVRIKIEDTGVGITNEDKKRLFTEGGHGKDSTKFNVHSTGHGLFIAKNIIDLHKGRVWVESKGEGKGTIFT